jgi:hypothetical protein
VKFAVEYILLPPKLLLEQRRLAGRGLGDAASDCCSNVLDDFCSYLNPSLNHAIYDAVCTINRLHMLRKDLEMVDTIRARVLKRHAMLGPSVENTWFVMILLPRYISIN